MLPTFFVSIVDKYKAIDLKGFKLGGFRRISRFTLRWSPPWRTEISTGGIVGPVAARVRSMQWACNCFTEIMLPAYWLTSQDPGRRGERRREWVVPPRGSDRYDYDGLLIYLSVNQSGILPAHYDLLMWSHVRLCVLMQLRSESNIAEQSTPATMTILKLTRYIVKTLPPSSQQQSFFPPQRGNI